MSLKLKEIYELALKMGKKAGPRLEKEYQEQLKKQKEEYEKMDKEQKAEFDQELLTNPFPDSRILAGDPNQKVSGILTGIDVDTVELLLAHELKKQGKKIDLVLSHHPQGKALISLGKVMDLLEDVFFQAGVPINVAEKLMETRVKELNRILAPINHYRAVDAARILQIAFACFHTVADNQVYSFLEKFLAQKKLKTVGEVVKALKEIPEYREAAKLGAGPVIFAGTEKSKAGKIVISGMTGGTEGSKDIYESLMHAGVGTLIDMHISEERRKKAEECRLNVIVAGHIGSDSLGLNLILDQIEKKGVKVYPCSGLIRIKR